MSGDRARDALSQCLPTVVGKHINNNNSLGYRMMADKLDEMLYRRGFRIISHTTYDRLTDCETKLQRLQPYRSRR